MSPEATPVPTGLHPLALTAAAHVAQHAPLIERLGEAGPETTPITHPIPLAWGWGAPSYAEGARLAGVPHHWGTAEHYALYHPARLAEWCGYLRYSALNDLDYGREVVAPGSLYSLTREGLTALAANDDHRDIARQIWNKVASSYQRWVPQGEDPVSSRLLKEMKDWLAEVQRAGGWT